MVLRHPEPAYISLTARRAQPAGPPPTQPTTKTPRNHYAHARNQRSPLDTALSISAGGRSTHWVTPTGGADGCALSAGAGAGPVSVMRLGNGGHEWVARVSAA